jgi:hypothetical protein
MSADAEREDEHDRGRGERLANEVSESELDVGANGIDPSRSAGVAAVVLVHGGVAELASCSEASLLMAHTLGDECFGSAVEMELHLFRHLSLDGRVAEDGANPITHAMQHWANLRALH